MLFSRETLSKWMRATPDQLQAPNRLLGTQIDSFVGGNALWLHARSAGMYTTNALNLSFRGGVTSLTASSARFRQWRRRAATAYAGSSVMAWKWESICSVARTAQIRQVS
jgi:hypothetical protein